MDRKKKIENEVRKTLELMDRDSGLPPDPYFYTRLSAKIEEREHSVKSVAALLRPALLIILFVLNVGTVAWYWGQLHSVNEGNARLELATILAGELQTQTQTLDILNLK
ncbi:MAG: hypothetical protein Kow0037_06290 [Calditrichia bacterium]